ncbi:hypothetical protein BASA61_010354 [Batrachochytrium salamandrivorans]|nr:hypothetical protein BASA61_010354 [Batrachochytrium salamandrivorans]
MLLAARTAVVGGSSVIASVIPSVIPAGVPAGYNAAVAVVQRKYMLVSSSYRAFSSSIAVLQDTAAMATPPPSPSAQPPIFNSSSRGSTLAKSESTSDTRPRFKSHIKRTPLSSIKSQLGNRIKLRPTHTRLEQDLDPSSRVNRFGQFDQSSWFDATHSTDPNVRVRALENSLKAGTDAQLISAYDAVRQLGADALSKISHRVYLAILERVVMTQTSGAFFGNVPGTLLADIAFRIRQDYLKSGHQSQIEMDLLVLHAARYAAATDLDKSILICRRVIDDYILGKKAESPANLADKTGSASADPSLVETNVPVTAVLNADICNELVAVFAMAKQPEICKKLIARMLSVGIQPQIATFCQLLIAYCTIGDMDTAESLSDQIFEHGDPIHAKIVREQLLAGFSKAGNITKTQKYFDQISQSIQPHTTSTYNSRMRVYCERGLPGDAFRIYREMRRDHIEANSETFTNLINVYGRAKNITAASRLYYKMEGVLGFKPSPEMQTAVLEAYLTAGDSLLAWRMVRHIVSPHGHVAKSQKLPNPDRDAKISGGPKLLLPTGMFSALAKDLSGKHIDYLRNRVDLSKIPIRARGAVLAKLMQAALVTDHHGPRDAKLVMALYSEFTEEKGCCVLSSPPPLAHVCAIEALGVLGQTEEAIQLFETTLDDTCVTGTVSLAYSALFSALGHASDRKMAHQVATKHLAHARRDGVVMSSDLLERIVGCFKEEDKAIKAVQAVYTGVDLVKFVMPVGGAHPKLVSALKSAPIDSLCALIY